MVNVIQVCTQLKLRELLNSNFLQKTSLSNVAYILNTYLILLIALIKIKKINRKINKK